ncbi:hypothetical protein Syun_013837 [Stephania yunnanensis]|uniref:Uncharacterized protein n=1 Tax=Stephania yunnanensis TaxID=152371 RepID=A0AAP0JKF1_9MAGN
MVQSRVTLVHDSSQHCQILSISTIRGLMAEAVARDKVRDLVECIDRDNDLVMHKDKDMDMVHLKRDFNVSVRAYGQPGTAEPETYSCYCHVRMLPGHILMEGDRWCVICLEVSEEPSSSRRSPARRGGAQPYSKMRVWPWASMALDGAGRQGSRPEHEVCGYFIVARTRAGRQLSRFRSGSVDIFIVAHARAGRQVSHPRSGSVDIS